jgi:RND family efflux transporter MFP subunit
MLSRPDRHRPTTRPSLALVVLVALVLLCAACSEGDEKTEDVARPLVETETVVLTDLEDRVTAVGEIVATHHAEIAAEVDGRVTELLVEEGAAVDADQPVLLLDPAKRRLELDRAEARVVEAVAQVENDRRRVARQRELFDQRIASQSTLDEAETALRLSEAKLTAARAALGVERRALHEATVRAPFAGLVVERKVSLGEYVRMGEPLVEIVSLDPVEVEFRVAEVDSSFVRPGQEVNVTVAPYPDRVFPAKVDVISPTIDPRTRTLRVKAALDNSDGLLRPGLFARADLGLDTREGVALIPSEAVLQRVDGSIVFVVEDGERVRRRVVGIAGFRDDAVVIESGLAAGEELVVRGHADLIDGQAVRVRRVSDQASFGTNAAERSAP